MTDQVITFDTVPLTIEQHGTLRTVGSTGVYRVMSADGRWTITGPRRAQRQAEYLARRARLGTEDGRNDMVDMCRVLAGMSMTRRANRAKAGSSVEGRARGAGRGQTPPMGGRRRAAAYGMQIIDGGPEVEYDRIEGGTDRQLRQLLRMGARGGEIGYRWNSKGAATPRLAVRR